MLGYFLKSHRVTFLIVAGIALLGIQALFSLPRESTPEIEIPIGVVVTVYPGASAFDIEELVTKNIEDEVALVSGVKTISSSSALGVSSVTVEFEADQDVKDSLRRLREAIANVSDLPTDAETPRVVEISFTNEPILSLSMTGVSDRRLLSEYADELADQLEQVTDVSSVQVVGGLTNEVVISVDSQALQSRGLTIDQVMGALRAANVNAPLGQLETTGFAYNVRLAGGFHSVADVAQTPVQLPGSGVVHLEDIATVELRASEPSSLSNVSIAGAAAKPAVTLEVRKRTGGNIVTIVDEVQKRAEEFREQALPKGVQLVSFADRADEIRTSLRDVSRSGLQTFVIVFAILWLFLGWKEAAIASLAVPLTFLTAFLVFGATDVSLNGISLFSLILSLGLLVDTAIVITEGIHVRLQAGTSDLTQSAHRVVKSFAKPLTGGVLTTVAAFFPMLLVSGIIGQFLRTIPIVLSAALLAALAIALFVLPAVAVQVFTRWPALHTAGKFDGYFDKLRQWYTGMIDRLIRNRRRQNIFIATLVVLLVIGFTLPFSGLLKTGLFPEVDTDFILGNIELASNAQLDKTAEAANQVETILRSIPEIKSFVINAGSATSLDIGGGGASASHLGSFYINLYTDRDRSSIEISEELNQRLQGIPGADVSILEVSAGPPTSSPIEIHLAGSNLNDLTDGSKQVMTRLQEINGVTEIDTTADISTSEFIVLLRRDQLAQYGLSAGSVAGILRQAIFSDEVTSFLDPQADDIRVRFEGADFTRTPDAVLDMPLLTANGAQVRVRDIATIELAPSLASIQRRDQERQITVTADVTGKTNANEVSQQILAEKDNLGLARGVELTVGGEQQETEDTFNELYRSMILAVIAIAAILVIEFNSYRQPLIIITTIPLALIGILFGLVITGGQLNFASFIGLVSLAGIVVNNAILLVDQANSHMAGGATPEEAMRMAADSRLRPIILTTITTAAGVAPLIFVDEFFRDMSLTIINGLLFSTVLTLVLIPILYIRQQHNEERRARRRVLRSLPKHRPIT